MNGDFVKLNCDCCHKGSISGAICERDGKIICSECLKYVKGYYGICPGTELIKYIQLKKKKSRHWWQRLFR